MTIDTLERLTAADHQRALDAVWSTVTRLIRESDAARAETERVRSALVDIVFTLATENYALKLLLDQAMRDPTRAQRDKLREELARYTAGLVA